MENSRTYNISNEHLLLISILNNMYNDNIEQINNLNHTITQITDSNRIIMNLLIQILHNPTNNTRRNNINSRRNNIFRNNNPTNSSSRVNYRGNPVRPTNFVTEYPINNRFFLNNTPYVIDNIQRTNIPINNSQGSEYNSFSRLLDSFFQPVTVYPTQSQLEIATRTVRYSHITTPINRSCPISLENFGENDMVTVIRYCGHIFNSDEINRWFRTNCRCPVCRYDIRNYNLNTRDVVVDTNVNHTLNENIPPLSETVDENNPQLEYPSNDELLESGEEINAELQRAPPILNTNDGNESSLILDIIIDGLTEENVLELLREIPDISGNFLSRNNSSINSFSYLINRAFNNSSYY